MLDPLRVQFVNMGNNDYSYPAICSASFPCSAKTNTPCVKKHMIIQYIKCSVLHKTALN